jgi:hypothetical protein
MKSGFILKNRFIKTRFAITHIDAQSAEPPCMFTQHQTPHEGRKNEKERGAGIQHKHTKNSSTPTRAILHAENDTWLSKSRRDSRSAPSRHHEQSTLAQLHVSRLHIPGFLRNPRHFLVLKELCTGKLQPSTLFDSWRAFTICNPDTV